MLFFVSIRLEIKLFVFVFVFVLVTDRLPGQKNTVNAEMLIHTGH